MAPSRGGRSDPPVLGSACPLIQALCSALRRRSSARTRRSAAERGLSPGCTDVRRQIPKPWASTCSFPSINTSWKVHPCNHRILKGFVIIGHTVENTVFAFNTKARGSVRESLCAGVRLGCTPDPCHEVRLSFEIAEPSIEQALIDVITDVIAVVGLVEDAAEIIHGDVELRLVLELNGVCKDQNSSWFKQAVTVLNHSLPGFGGQFMHQKNAGQGLKPPLIEGHAFRISLH